MAHLSQLTQHSSTSGYQVDGENSLKIEGSSNKTASTDNTRTTYLLRSRYKSTGTRKSQRNTIRSSYGGVRKKMKIQEETVHKAEILVDYNKKVLNKLSELRKNTTNVLKKNINTYETLQQQFNRPQRSMEELKLNYASIQILLDDLKKFI